MIQDISTKIDVTVNRTLANVEEERQVLKMMVGNNLKDTQLQQIVDKTILLYDKVFHFQVLPQST